MTRQTINPITEDIPAARQELARHYGVHPYFTRRPSNVVRAYVERYSHPNDVVLDPFGGSGVTAIEAMLLGRRGIQNDLNPFANFIAAAIADTSKKSTATLRRAFERVSEGCRRDIEQLEIADEQSIAVRLRQLTLPENIPLPRSSDAKFFYDLFTPRQLAGLAIIKDFIERETDRADRQSLLLAWSAAVAKLNKTFLSAKGRAESRGGSSIFSIYRYKLATQIVELPVWGTFYGRFLNILAAKEEILQLRDYSKRRGAPTSEIDGDTELRVISTDASHLRKLLGDESVDYIFTDPPYGGHIAYLDLSILWNHWLGLKISDPTAEAIVGGEMRLTEAHYKTKLAQSMRECMKLLRRDRWLTVVFQHWDVSYFRVILDTVAEEGGSLRAAITHDKDVIWSMHKKKNAASVLSGEMLLTFYKSNSLVSIKKPAQEPLSLDALLDRFLPDLPPAGFRTETLFNKLVIEAWERQSLGNITVGADEIRSKLHERGWHYDPHRHLWATEAKEVKSELSFV